MHCKGIKFLSCHGVKSCETLMPWTLYAWFSEELIKTWWCIYASVNSVIIGLIID